MAQVSNYGELKAWIATFGHRSDLTADIPGFIQNAESMIAADVRAIEMVTTTTLEETDRASGAVYTLPTNFLGARNVTGTRSSTGYNLKQVAIAELYSYGLSGDPFLFSTYGGSIEFRGSPAVNDEFTLIYYARPTAFSGDSDTNTLLTSHPGLYQHAAMYWLHLHTQDVELASGHIDAFSTEVESVNALAEEIRGAAGVANQYNYSCGSSM